MPQLEPSPGRSTAEADLAVLLTRSAPEIEAQLKPQLKGLLGGLIRGYLPQVWVFKTESDTASLVVSAVGDVRVFRGEARPVDVLIEWGHAQLTTALRERRKSAIPPGGPPSTSFFSPKGRTAFNFLRNRLGI